MKQLIILFTLFSYSLSAQLVRDTLNNKYYKYEGKWEEIKVSNCLYLNLQERQVILNLDTYFEISSYCKLINDVKQTICHKPFVKLGDVVGEYKVVKYKFDGKYIVISYEGDSVTEVYLKEDEVYRVIKVKNNIVEYFNK